MVGAILNGKGVVRYSWAVGSLECICWGNVVLNVLAAWHLGVFEGSLISVRHLSSPTEADYPAMSFFFVTNNKSKCK